MNPNGLHPLPWLSRSPVAGSEKNVSSGGFQSHGHGRIACETVRTGREIAEIIFQVINAPGGKGFRVDEFVVIG